MFLNQKIILALLMVCSFFPFVSKAEEERVINGGILTISQDTAWEGTVILDGVRVNIEQNATLTIKPGTTIAGKNGGMIFVIGKLKAIGEQDKKIRFTAENNSEAKFSLSYSLNSTATSEITMENFILENGGGNQDIAMVPALTIKGKGSLAKGVIRRNRVSAVRIWTSSVTVQDCEIYQNESISLENKSTGQILAENNWWGSEEKPKTSTGQGNWISGNFDYDPWQNKGPIPVILLPGIGGSFSFRLLNNQASDIWLPTPVGTTSYRYITEAFKLAGYSAGQNLFWSFYDWRLPCEEIAQKYLKTEIERAKKESGHLQVNLVAHSMGGLVARAYIQGDEYQDDVDQLITAGTPHLGSSEVYSIWEGGDFLGKKWPINLYLWYLKNQEENWNRLSYIRQNFPSIGEMMPIYDYLIQAEDNQKIAYTNQKIKNPFLEKLDSQLALIQRRTKNSFLAGNDQKTLETIKVQSFSLGEGWEDGIPNPRVPIPDSQAGDGTVPTQSAIANNKITKENLFLKSNHGNLFKLGQKKIFDQLGIAYKPSMAIQLFRHLIISTQGKAKWEITDEKGKILSENNQTIPDSQYLVDENKEQKFLLADFPFAIEETAKKFLINILGEQKGEVKTAFWHSNEEDDYASVETKDNLDEGVSLTYEIALNQNSDYLPEVQITNKHYSNLLKVTSPIDQKEYLDWQIITPQADIWQESSDLKEGEIEYKLDGETINSSIDLANLDLGNHFLSADGHWQQQNLDESETKEISFAIKTSCKSLITLSNRLFQEEKILSWERRSEIINLLTQSYQNLSNGEIILAKEKIAQAKNILLNLEGKIIPDEQVKNKIIKSLNYLEDDPA